MTRQEKEHWALILEIRKAVLELDGRYLMKIGSNAREANCSRIQCADEMIDMILRGSIATPEYIKTYGISVIQRISEYKLIVF